MSEPDPVSSFIEAACVPRDSWHGSGTLEQAETILSRHPHVAVSNIFTAAILGDEAADPNELRAASQNGRVTESSGADGHVGEPAF